MDENNTVSRRKFVGGVATAAGVLGIRPRRVDLFAARVQRDAARHRGRVRRRSTSTTRTRSSRSTRTRTGRRTRS